METIFAPKTNGIEMYIDDSYVEMRTGINIDDIYAVNFNITPWRIFRAVAQDKENRIITCEVDILGRRTIQIVGDDRFFTMNRKSYVWTDSRGFEMEERARRIDVGVGMVLIPLNGSKKELTARITMLYAKHFMDRFNEDFPPYEPW
jgi:hypothetical protein